MCSFFLTKKNVLKDRLTVSHLRLCVSSSVNIWKEWSSSNTSWTQLKLLNPTAHVMHQQFNIQQLYVLPTLYLCVLYVGRSSSKVS